MKIIIDKYDNKLIVIDLRCGNNKCKGAIGIEINPNTSADILADVTNKYLPIKNNSIDLVIAKSFREHLNNPLDFIIEIHRILKAGGKFRAYVPHAFGRDAFDDPTHRSFYTVNTVKYFYREAMGFYTHSNFKLGYCKLRIKITPPANNIFTKKILELVFFPINFILWVCGSISPRVFEEFIKLPFIVGELYFELIKST